MTKAERFAAFVAERETEGDWARFISPDSSRLIRKDICFYCSFSRSTLYQNSAIKSRLAGVENQLRNRGMMLASDGAKTEARMEHLLADTQLEEQMLSLDRRLSAVFVDVENLAEQFNSTERAAARSPLPDDL